MVAWFVVCRNAGVHRLAAADPRRATVGSASPPSEQPRRRFTHTTLTKPLKIIQLREAKALDEIPMCPQERLVIIIVVHAYHKTAETDEITMI